MGGKALKSIYTERKTTEQFMEIEDKLLPLISTGLGNPKIHVVRCYKNKDTHGDMDILIRFDETMQNVDLRKVVKEQFKPNEIFYNGGVVSFDYDEFQIDLIPVRKSNWETAKAYFDYDPTGNIMGKVANSIRFNHLDLKGRLSYGFNGLSAVIYSKDTDKKLGDILLSRDNEKIFNLLDYDYDRFLDGFYTKQEIFDFSVCTKFFQHKRFLMENLSHKDRKRNRKRQTYHEFLKFIEESKIEDREGNGLDKYEQFYDIDRSFPHVDFAYKVVMLSVTEHKNREISKKFNGHILMKEFPELKGEELGKWIGQFKGGFSDWSDYVLTHTPEQIMTDFKLIYKRTEV